MPRLDGGHAFPSIIDHPEEFKSIDGSPLTNYQAQRLEHVSGMSLLDYFAGAALPSVLGIRATNESDVSFSDMAAISYEIALAMIEQKERLND